jgi:hypothetical protein
MNVETRVKSSLSVSFSSPPGYGNQMRSYRLLLANAAGHFVPRNRCHCDVKKGDVRTFLQNKIKRRLTIKRESDYTKSPYSEQSFKHCRGVMIIVRDHDANIAWKQHGREKIIWSEHHRESVSQDEASWHSCQALNT